MTPDTLSRLTSLGSADTLARDVEVVAPRVLSELVTPGLSAAGFRRFDDWDTETTRTYQVSSDATRRVTYTDFCAETRQAVVRVLEDALGEATGGGLRRITATRNALVRDQRGARTWLRAAVEYVRDHLPELTDEQLDRVAKEPRSNQPAAATTERRESAALARAASRAVVEEDLRHVLARWLPTLPDGAHPLPAVWEAFERVRAQPGTRLDDYPGIQLAGRNAFYRIAAEVANVRSIGGHRRVLEVPYSLRVRSLIRRRQLVEALRLQQSR